MKKKPSTITDIARALNVSPSTVSRALHDSPSISEETKRAVMDLAEKLDYQPNLVALNFLNNKTKTIGVIVPEITSYFFATVINGIQDMASTGGYKLMINQSNESYEEEMRIIEALSLSRVDGFLISPSSETMSYEHLDRLKTLAPLVVFDRDCPDFEADKVLVDDYDGALQAVEYLLRTNCKRIAYITGPQNLSTCKHRREGYIQALLMNNIVIDESLIVTTSGFTSECGVEAAKSLLNLPSLPDAIFAVNDAVAIGAMSVIRSKGLKIPDDISVVGFDDEPYSKYFYPSLTTVWQPVYDLGMLSAKILMNHLHSESDEQTYRYELLKAELMIRDSSKPI